MLNWCLTYQDFLHLSMQLLLYILTLWFILLNSCIVCLEHTPKQHPVPIPGHVVARAIKGFRLVQATVAGFEMQASGLSTYLKFAL